MKFVFLSFLSLAPILGRRRLQSAFLGPSAAEASSVSASPSSQVSAPSFDVASTADVQASRGTWARVVAWRSRLRAKLAGGPDEELLVEQRRWERELREKELAELVQEKRRMQSIEELPS
jgi:hypothetical protein